MWSTLFQRPFSGLSPRGFGLLFLAVAIALFTAASTFNSASAQTAPEQEAMATWSGENLQYGAATLTRSTSPTTDDNVPNLVGTDCENSPYVYYSPVGTNPNNPNQYQVYIICLGSPYDGSDKTVRIPIAVIPFAISMDQYNPDEDKPAQFNLIGTTIRTHVAPLGTDAAGNTTADSQATPTSCDPTFTHGIGWMICPVTNFLADAMDWLYGILTSFLVVQPILTDSGSPLYRGWNFMRNVANVLFVVGFLIIIYSQNTSLGLSNYGIKRLLPRLIIAAVLVNVSYWITALAVDISNISGYALHEVLISLRDNLVIPNGDASDIGDWSKLAQVVLAGAIGAGTVTIAGVALSAATAGSIGAAVFLLVPVLLGVLSAALIAIIILAARQAIITILVIVSPIAFVAYLLPNTEKYFDRWRDLFQTMLLVFPLFSIVFGGSQLAGTAIIQSAPSSALAIPTIILGLAVQVAPLVITPLLIRLSGSLIGRIAGIVNNPNRGLIDRAKNFSNERKGLFRGRAMGDYRRNADGTITRDANGNPVFNRTNGMARIARGFDNRKRSREGYQKAYEAAVTAEYENSHDSHNIEFVSKLAHTREEIGKAEAQRAYLSSTDGAVVSSKVRVAVLNDQNKGLEQRDSADLDELRAGRVNARFDSVPEVTTYADIAREALTRNYIDTNRSNVAKGVGQGIYAQIVTEEPGRAEEAGGIDDDYGALKARASANAIIERGKAETVKNIQEGSDLNGKQAELNVELRRAMQGNNAAGMRAYSDMLAKTGSGGIAMLRDAIREYETSFTEDVTKEFKRHIDQSGEINAAAEDIANWSRDTISMGSMSGNTAMWRNMKPAKWANMAKSSQLEAIRADGVTKQMAQAIVADSSAFSQLKVDDDPNRNVQQIISRLAREP